MPNFIHKSHIDKRKRLSKTIATCFIKFELIEETQAKNKYIIHICNHKDKSNLNFCKQNETEKYLTMIYIMTGKT